MNIIVPLSIALFAICLAAFVSYLLINSGSDVSRNMRKLAAALNLPLLGGERMMPKWGWISFRRKPVFILDLWRGRELNIYHIVSGNGKAKTVNGALDVPVVASTELRMSFSAVGWLTQAGMQFGLKPVSTGDEAFDKKFSVKSTDTDIAVAILQPEIRAQFAKVWSTNDVRGLLSLREGRIHYEESGAIKTEDQRARFVAMAALCNALAEAVDKHAPAQVDGNVATDKD